MLKQQLASSNDTNIKSHVNGSDISSGASYLSGFNMEIDFEQETGQKCPYCSRSDLKSVNIHIGHVHKCKLCRKLTWECAGHLNILFC